MAHGCLRSNFIESTNPSRVWYVLGNEIKLLAK